jgi:hypothetical protein
MVGENVNQRDQSPTPHAPPTRPSIETGIVGQPLMLTSIRAHDIDLEVPVAVRLERYLLAVR